MRSLLRAARTRESVDEGALHARLDAGHRQDREPVGSTDVAGDAAGISGDGDHSPTKTKSPQTNGIVEWFHKTLLDEFYRVVFRKKIYGSIAEPQDDLDSWVQSYNEERAHQGRWFFGKTPMQTFLDATPLATEKMIAA
jgi:hypothetical protein